MVADKWALENFEKREKESKTDIVTLFPTHIFAVLTGARLFGNKHHFAAALQLCNISIRQRVWLSALTSDLLLLTVQPFLVLVNCLWRDEWCRERKWGGCPGTRVSRKSPQRPTMFALVSLPLTLRYRPFSRTPNRLECDDRQLIPRERKVDSRVKLERKLAE